MSDQQEVRPLESAKGAQEHVQSLNLDVGSQRPSQSHASEQNEPGGQTKATPTEQERSTDFDAGTSYPAISETKEKREKKVAIAEQEHSGDPDAGTCDPAALEATERSKEEERVVRQEHSGDSDTITGHSAASETKAEKGREPLGLPLREDPLDSELKKDRLDSEYFPDSERDGGEVRNIDTPDTPTRYKLKPSDPERQARSQARADARRTRKILRTQSKAEIEEHYKINTSEESDESSVDENYDCDSLAETEVENLTWRGRVQHVLHNHWFHVTIAILVSVDAVIVIFELLIDVGAFNNVLCEGTNFVEQAETCHYRDHSRCYPLAKMILEGTNISASPSGLGKNSELCECGFRGGRRVCIRVGESPGINPALVLHILSILILSSFLVEGVLKIVAFRLKYFTHKFEVFDGVIVLISWVLDVSSIVQEEAFEAASLIIVLRLWRVIRIVNGAVISSKSQSDQQLEASRAEARRIIHALHKAQDKMDHYEDENIRLKMSNPVLVVP